MFIGVVAVVSLIIVAAAAIAWKASTSLLYPEDEAQPERPAGLVIEDVSFQSGDGTEISGWYIPPPTCVSESRCEDAPAMVLSHGRGSNRGGFQDEIPLLHRKGFALLAFDYRGMGTSEDVATTAGAKEPQDLVAAVEFVKTQQGVNNQPVAVYGKSLGATIALLAARDNPAIGPVISESGFARLSEVVGYNFELETGLPPMPLAPASIWIAERRAGVDLDDVDAVEALHNSGERPLLIIHSRDDERVRFDQGEQLFEAAKEPKTFWQVDGENHASTIAVAPGEFDRRLSEFLNRHYPS